MLGGPGVLFDKSYLAGSSGFRLLGSCFFGCFWFRLGLYFSEFYIPLSTLF